MADTVTVKLKGDARDLNSKLAKVQRGLAGVHKSSALARKGLGSIGKTAVRVGNALVVASTALAAFATAAAVRSIISVTTEMEGFRAQLTTYLGDQRLANAEMERLGKLANSLPQDIGDLTQAFVVFTRFGIGTSNDEMTAFANIAAANSKSVAQFAEAVADSLTGEFERLKEFGIKVSQENGKFIGRIGDDVVAVGTSASDLTKQLTALGQENGRFAGAAAAQADTLGTALSNLRGSLYLAADAVGQGGFGAAIAEAARQVTDYITNNEELVRQLSVDLTTAFIFLKDVLKVVIANIDLLAYAFIALIAISIGAKIAAIASVLGSVLAGALILATKAVVLFNLAIKRNPIIFGVSMVILGITKVAGSFDVFSEAAKGAAGGAKLAGDETNDLAKEQTTFQKIMAAGNGLLERASGGVSDLKQAYAEARAEAQRFADEAAKNNKSYSATQIAAIKAAKEIENNAKVDKAYREKQQGYIQTAMLATQQELDLQQKRLEMINNTAVEIAAEEAVIKAVSAAKKAYADITEETLQQLGQEMRDRTTLIETTKAQIALETQLAAARLTAGDALGGSIATQKREIEELNKLMSQTQGDPGELTGVLLQKEKQLRKEILELIGAGAGALEKQQEIEIDRIEYLRDQQIINAEEAGRAVAQINRKYADEIHDYKIQKMEDELARELEMNGIRTQLGGKDVELLKVNRETAKKIARDKTEFEKKTEFDKTQFFLEQGATVFNALGAQNRKAFEAAKAMNIAVAIMNTYRAATIALASYPPPFNFIAMAASIATGFAQVAAIRSQQFSGRALGGGVMGGGSYLVGERGPEIFSPATNGGITRNSDINSGGTTEVNFTIVANDTRGFDQLLTERRGLITQIIADANLERGRR